MASPSVQLDDQNPLSSKVAAVLSISLPHHAERSSLKWFSMASLSFKGLILLANAGSHWLQTDSAKIIAPEPAAPPWTVFLLPGPHFEGAVDLLAPIPWSKNRKEEAALVEALSEEWSDGSQQMFR